MVFPTINDAIYTMLYEISFVALVCLNIITSGNRSLPRVTYLIVVVLIIGSIVAVLHGSGHYPYTRMIMMLTSVSLLALVNKKIGLTNFYDVYNKWMTLMAVFCAIGFLLAYFGFPPIFEISSSNDGRAMNCWIITCAKVASGQDMIGNMMRPSGFFDEPGAMGYWGVFAIAINRLFIKNTKLEKILIVSLIFTFSMGYFMQIIVYLLFFSIKGGVTGRKILLFAILFLSYYTIENLKDTEYHAIYDYSIGRIDAAQQGVDFMEGTSREFNAEQSKEAFHKNPFWGNGRRVGGDNFNDNAYETLAYDGLWGTFYLYFPYIVLLFWSIKRRDSDLLGIIIFLLMSVFHRPFHSNLLTFFVVYSIPIMYYQNVICATANSQLQKN